MNESAPPDLAEMERRIHRLVDMISSAIAPVHVDLVHEMADAGEPGLAVEWIADVLVHSSTPVSADVVREIRLLFTAMRLDQTRAASIPVERDPER